MKINPENWLLNKDKSILLNIENGKAIKKKDDCFEICNSISEKNGYCKIVDKMAPVPHDLEKKYFVDDLLYAKLKRVFRDGFDYSDYSLF